MNTFFWILIFTFSISLVSFSGALILFLKEKVLNRVLLLLVAFSAGAFLGSAFLDLIPEALEGIEFEQARMTEVFLYLIFGFCSFFILEQFIQWHHHHSLNHPEIKVFSRMILFSDGLHNFIDGVVIAGAFMVGFPVGVAAALAVALHEIPQGVGNFSCLLYGGFKKTRALFLNFIANTTIILGGVFGFLLAEKAGEKIFFILPFAAGGFIYVAASDLIPQIKEEWGMKKSALHFLLFLAGIALMWVLTSFLA
ncbi:MAG: ZIP family metal transporter [bacterium]